LLRGAAILLLPALADRRPYDAADFNQRFERNGVGRLADAGGASLFHVRDGKVTRVVQYLDATACSPTSAS
jgi:hypothetical protein